MFISSLNSEKVIMREKCPYSEFFWSEFSQMRENTDQKNSEYGQFAGSASDCQIKKSMFGSISMAGA